MKSHYAAEASQLTAFAEAEYRTRLDLIRRSMEERELDALLITSEDNFRYITGFSSPTWVNLTRPRYCVVPLRGDPCLIVPSNNRPIAIATSWITDIRTWVSPNPADDGISLLLDALKGAARQHGRIGAELGPQSRLTMPVGDFLRLKQLLEPVEMVDGDWMLREIRMIKSPAEVQRIRQAADVASAAFEQLPNAVSLGISERQFASTFAGNMIKLGAQSIPYMICVSGVGGYSSLHLFPTDRAITSGDVVVIDVGCTIDGYFCDIDREFSFGSPSDVVRRLHDALWRATEAGIRAAEPGRKICDIWQAQASVLEAELPSIGSGARHAANGRMGHGVGLRLTEPPSVHPADQTLIRPGMVLTIEPAAEFLGPGQDGQEIKLATHEENIVVTENGPVLLSRRTSRQMPVIS